jgi:hypothetical protein
MLRSSVPEQKRTSIDLEPSPTIKKVCLGLPDASKVVVIGANLDPKEQLALTSFLRDNTTSSHGACPICPVSR